MWVRQVAFAGLAAGLGSCAGGMGGLFGSPSPYERYVEALEKAGLAGAALGRDWTTAGEAALAGPVPARLPLRETGYFPPELPSAVAYRIDLPRGRILEVEVAFESLEPARLFVELFQVRSDDPPRRVAWVPEDSARLRYEVRRDGAYLLRIQPELLRSGRYTVVQRTRASLVFPVPGFGTGAILSGFGAERDAGRREHHGVDIFVPRGTPALAVATGTAHAGINELGGNVVWLADRERRRTFYYAHLDRWAKEGSARVEPGDTVGFIGNTGNARTTRPHLHFAIYERGPVDPFPFLEEDDPAPPPVAVSLDRLDQWVRVTAPRTILRSGTDPRTDSLELLVRGAVGRVLAGSAGAMRIRLPGGLAGYVDAGAAGLARQPLRRQALPAGATLRESPSALAPAIEVLDRPVQADVLGRHDEFELVRLPDGRLGWLPRG